MRGYEWITVQLIRCVMGRIGLWTIISNTAADTRSEATDAIGRRLSEAAEEAAAIAVGKLNAVDDERNSNGEQRGEQDSGISPLFPLFHRPGRATATSAMADPKPKEVRGRGPAMGHLPASRPIPAVHCLGVAPWAAAVATAAACCFCCVTTLSLSALLLLLFPCSPLGASARGDREVEQGRRARAGH